MMQSLAINSIKQQSVLRPILSNIFTRATTAASIQKRCFHEVYCWGTSKKGIIPIPPAYDDKGSHMIDHPQQLDIDTVFGFAEDGNLLKSPLMKQLACGHTTSAAVFEDGECFTWGANDSGQLGHGHKEDIYKPTLLTSPPELASIGISSISLGPTFSALIDKIGDVHTFGYNGSALSGGMGCLGHGDNQSYNTPKRVESLVEDGCLAQQVVVGDSHMTVLTTEGEVLTAGSGSYGRLGNLESTDQLYLEPVELLAGEKVVEIAGGNAFNLALTEEGIVHAWGRNDKGQLGVGGSMMVDIYAMENLPRPIEGQLEGRKVVKIAAGHTHSACITNLGELFVWGMGNNLEPQMVNTMSHSKCIDIACGNNYTMILTKDGKLYSFGKNKTGVLGHAHTKTLNQPELIEGMAKKRVIQIDAGLGHCSCIAFEPGQEDLEELKDFL